MTTPREDEPGFTLNPRVIEDAVHQMVVTARVLGQIAEAFHNYARAIAHAAETFARLGETLGGGDNDDERAASPQAPAYDAGTPGC